ncbi:hypothetical protein [Mesorhizobium sp. B2-5-11]|uniref:hypothetical protein n=1 Tax=Mesorhizobium sp. B2-5-11 TaxID=2589919 RepID=UPI00112CABB5|nr:hypothetical protein [Mesorhizobium sp. B2-5-11]TPK14115.1 hypothetical protein FJ490_01990 [Mesorhizobium sp. B2-5-11]
MSADKLIERLRIDLEKGWPPLCSPENIRTLLDLIASIQADNLRLKTALEEERGRNRKLHRRAQFAEALNQSVEGILSEWSSLLLGPDGKKTPRYYEHHLFGIALCDIMSQRKKLAARSLSQAGEGEQ